MSLIELATALGRHKKLFLSVALLGTAASLAIALAWPRVFTATTVLLPSSQSSVAAGALAQLGVLSGMGSGLLGAKSQDETYVALLRTRRLQDQLLRQFQLQRRYEAKTPEQARHALSKKVDIVLDKKSGLISVSVDDPDAVFAAQLANAHVDELRRLLGQFAVTEAQQRRVFFQDQVRKAKEALDQAEVDFRKQQEIGGLVLPQAVAESVTRSASELRGQIIAKEAQLNAAARFTTLQNPQTRQLSAELAALRQQLLRLEQGGGGNETGRFGGMEAVKAYRAMRVHEATLQGLIVQLEVARVEESRESTLIQQVDVAHPPETPSKPRRALIVLLGAFSSVIVGGSLALLKASLIFQSRRQPDQWRGLKDAWR